eukprot:gene12317-13587_t
MSYLDELDLEEEGLTPEEIKKRKTKIFVGGLKYTSKDDVLKEYFGQFGEIEEAVVIYDRDSGSSKGYGFVTMSTDEGAELAIKDKSPRLDGRRCNVNLAYIGQKKKCVTGKGKPCSLTLQSAQIYPTSPTYLQSGYQQKVLANGQGYYSPTTAQLRYPMYGQIGVPYINQCQHAYYAIPGSSPTYDQRDGTTYMQPYVVTQQFVVAGNNTNGYTSPTATNNNNNSNNNNSTIPNYNHVAFIGQYPVLMETAATNQMAQLTSTTPTYASSPGPTTCATNGNSQMFHFHQQEIINQ